MSFAFHIEVAIGVGKPDDAATAGAEPNQAVTAQRVNIDPKCEFALYRRPPAASSVAWGFASTSSRIFAAMLEPMLGNNLTARNPATRSRGFTPRRHGHAGRADLNSVVWFWW